MGKQFYRDDNKKGGSYSGRDEDFILTKARVYVPAIEKLLDLDGASTLDIKNGVEKVEELVKNNAGVKTHQVRNIFNLVKDTGKEKDKDPVKELNRLRPKLAYVGARQTGNDGKIIVKVVDELIVKISAATSTDKMKLLKGLHYVMESIVAYHKFYSKDKD